MEAMRVAKLLAERGLCSRREADEYLAKGWVLLDGKSIQGVGAKCYPNQTVSLVRQASERQTGQVTILLNKPIGYVSGQPEKGYKAAVGLIDARTQYRAGGEQARFKREHLQHLAPAGRLDIDSQGLLVLTQDGRIARQLIGAESKVEKEYLVRVVGKIDHDGLARLNHGLSLDGVKLQPAKVVWQNDDQLRFVLREGRKRQIRRMCEQVGLRVVGLKRIRIGRIRLGDLPVGQWRYLRADERF